MASKRGKRGGARGAKRARGDSTEDSTRTRRPFVLQIHGDGVDVDVRVESGSPINQIAERVAAGMMANPAFAHGVPAFAHGVSCGMGEMSSAMPGDVSPKEPQTIFARSAVAGLATADLRDLDDAQLEETAALISDEQRRRVEARS